MIKKFLFLFFVYFHSHSFATPMLQEGETDIDIKCNIEGCNQKYPITATRLSESKKPNETILIWLPGGHGQHLSNGVINLLWGRVNILTASNPYKILSYGNGVAVPQAYGKDQPARIRSLIEWARNQGYKNIYLGGHSNGGARALGYLIKYNNHNLNGVIFSATNVNEGSAALRVDRVQWSIPALVVWHEGDKCETTRPQLQKRMFKKIKEKNKKMTEGKGIPLEGKSTSTCLTGGGHHWYDMNQKDHANIIFDFMVKNNN